MRLLSARPTTRWMRMLSALLPGTMTPLCFTFERTSRRRSPRCFCGPWHDRHVEAKMGWTSFTKSTLRDTAGGKGASSSALERAATRRGTNRKAQASQRKCIEGLPSHREGRILPAYRPRRGRQASVAAKKRLLTWTGEPACIILEPKFVDEIDPLAAPAARV